MNEINHEMQLSNHECTNNPILKNNVKGGSIKIHTWNEGQARERGVTATAPDLLLDPRLYPQGRTRDRPPRTLACRGRPDHLWYVVKRRYEELHYISLNCGLCFWCLRLSERFGTLNAFHVRRVVR